MTTTHEAKEAIRHASRQLQRAALTGDGDAIAEATADLQQAQTRAVGIIAANLIAAEAGDPMDSHPEGPTP